MKRIIVILLSVLLIAFAAAGCGGGYKSPDTPIEAGDPEALLRWDEHAILAGVPRYSHNGIFQDIYNGDSGMTVVSILGVSEEDFVAYTDELQAQGYKLAEGSSIWTTQGMSGVPIFEKGNKTVTLVWLMNGSLDIGVEEK